MQSAVYSLIPQGKIREVLETLSVCIGLPVRLTDADGMPLDAYSEEINFCKLLWQHPLPKRECVQTRRQAGGRAQRLGEAYIFSCHAKLTYIAFPLIHRDALLGTILVGPFLMDTPDSTIVSNLSDKYALPAPLLLELYDGLSGIAVLAPARVTHISKLINHLLSPLLPDELQMAKQNREKLGQQSRISETIRMYKTQELQNTQKYPFDKEKELLVQVKTGNVPAAKGVLNDLLGYVLFCEGGQITTMKNRALELATLLSRVAIEGGAVTDSIFHLNNRFIAALQEVENMEALCYQLQEIVEAFMGNMFLFGKQSGSEAVRRAMRYIAQHFADPLSLESVAEQVRLSPVYFSGLFRRTAGTGFTEYLNQARIEEGKRLLTSTDYSIVDIAVAVGYADQSYFSKVFKKHTGLSPRLYR
jgi:two-component system, response regulator YesN